MSHSVESIDKLVADVGGIFDHPAFLPLKLRDAAFGLVRVSNGDVLWVNDSASAFWGTRDLPRLRQNFAAPFGPGLGLESLVRGTTVWAAPRLGRVRLAHGFRLRNHVVLFRTGTDADGAVLLGFALPETAADEDHAADQWRRGSDESGIVERADALASPPTAARQDVAEQQGHATNDASDPEPDGLSLARRSQIAVLRDRLQAAVDGAGSLRLLWRTDADGRATQLDAETFTRLGTRLSFDRENFASVIGTCDAAAGAQLASALATRATWSGVTVRLPVADALAWVPWTLSASPIFAPGRSFSGFRGFGTIDLGQLELAPPRQRPALDGDRPADDPLGAASDVPPTDDDHDAGSKPDDTAGVLEQHPGARSDEPAAVPIEVALPHRDPAETTLPVQELERASSSANVVHLRRPFPTGGTGRFGAVLHQETMAGDSPRVEEATDAPVAQATLDQEQEGEAFRALREALLAQIPASLDSATMSDDGPHRDPKPSETDTRDVDELPASLEATDRPLITETGAPFAGDAAPRPVEAELSPPVDLIDVLPVGVLVTGAGLPLFANPAAAGRLGYAGVADLIGKGRDLLVSELSMAGTGSLVLRDAEDRAVAMPAERHPIDWHGVGAVLWTIGLPTPERTTASASPIGPAARGGEQPDVGDQGSGELLDRVDDAVALLDTDGRIRRLNRRGETWFTRPGHTSAIGTAFTQLLAPESRAAGLALLGDVKGQKDGAGAAPLQRDVVARTVDLATMPVLLTMGGLGASGFYLTLRDVTALRRAERDQALARRDHERDSGRLPEFLAKVSHEIRTPLNAILGFAEVMIEERFGPLGSARYKDYLKDIHASGTQVVSLVSDLLDLSRIEAGRMELEVGALDVNKIVSETVAQMQPEAHRERVIMRMSLGARAPAVLADERSVRTIVQNLLSNAVKFNEPGGQVIVSTALSDAGAVVLRVRDTGVGMTDAEITAALEPFQPVSAQKHSTGNGLGLPLTRALVGANGASMAIRSRPREGTLVEVAFALASADAARLPA